ncbi:helix-turn-helix domain-containing protein [Lysinibacillus sp. NPDC093692]|uniref:helix-turn-helix domain-containing protein n=1 Tax=Lysinibacillus sp. NPDC093692 TaxID=3390578 RepID=UPI003D050936
MTQNYSFDTKDEFINLVQSEILNTSEALEELNISRQALNSLVKRGKLVPVKELSRDRLFLREDIENRKDFSSMRKSKNKTYGE